LLARRLDLSTSPSRQDQRSLLLLLRTSQKKPLLSTELGGTERLYLSAQLLFNSSGAGSSPREAQKKARRPSSHSGHRKSSATYAIGDSSLRMIRLSSVLTSPRVRQPPVRAPRENPLYLVAFNACK